MLIWMTEKIIAEAAEVKQNPPFLNGYYPVATAPGSVLLRSLFRVLVKFLRLFRTPS